MGCHQGPESKMGMLGTGGSFAVGILFLRGLSEVYNESGIRQAL